MRLATGLDVLRLRDFRLVFSAALASVVGDGVVPVALAFAVLDLTGSATDLGIVLAARTLALTASLLIGGVVADRLGRRTIMLGADLVRLVAQGAIGVMLVSGHATVAEIAISQAVLGAAGGFFYPASSGLIPAVAGEHLQQANALRGMATAGGNVAGPVIAGVLVATIGAGAALLVDAASFGVSAALLARVPADAGLTTAAPARFFVELREGFAEVRSRTWVWTTIAAFSFVNMLGAAVAVLGPVVAKRDLGGAAAWAAILAARAAGWLGGAVTSLRVTPRRPLVVSIAACSTAALPLFLLAIPAPLVALIPAALALGAGTMLFDTIWETTLQQHVPVQARSRVSSYDWFGSFALQPLGFAIVGPLAGVVGVSATLYGCSGLVLLALGGLLAVEDVRRIGPAAAEAPAD